MNQDLCQTQGKLAETLGVTQQATLNRLEAMSLVQKQGKTTTKINNEPTQLFFKISNLRELKLKVSLFLQKNNK